MLNKGEQLYRGQTITSINGRFAAIMQPDGNFVVMSGRVVLWETRTNGRGYRVLMQNDGYLVIYDPKDTLVWTSTNKEPGEYLVCQDDGNLVLLSISDSSGRVLWASNTTQSILN